MSGPTLRTPPTPRRRDAAVNTLRSTHGRGVSLMVMLSLVASALNYASNVVFSRVLDPVGFGELTSLLALAVIVAVPTGAAQTVIAERVAVHAQAGRLDQVRYLIRHAVGHLVAVAIAVALIYAACIPLIIDLFNLRVPGPAIALSGVILCGFLVPVAFGVLQGLDRFLTFGLMLVAVSLSRIVFGVTWAALGGGAGGAIAGQALGMGAILVLSAWLLRGLLLGRGTGAATTGLLRKPDARAITASAAFVAFAVVSNLDVLLARVFLDPEEVGTYAAIATVGKIVTFMPAAVAIVMVPSAARAHQAGESSQVLRLSALLVGATATVAAIPAVLAPGLVIDVMFGPGYEAARSGVLPIVCAGAALAMLNLLVVYSVAIRDQRWGALLLIGVGIQTAGVAAFHESPAQVATVQAVAALTVLVVNEAFSHSLIRPRRSRRP